MCLLIRYNKSPCRQLIKDLQNLENAKCGSRPQIIQSHFNHILENTGINPKRQTLKIIYGFAISVSKASPSPLNIIYT